MPIPVPLRREKLLLPRTAGGRITFILIWACESWMGKGGALGEPWREDTQSTARLGEKRC